MTDCLLPHPCTTTTNLHPFPPLAPLDIGSSHVWLYLQFLRYTPVHLIESVVNCGLCMRWYLACSSYVNVMHRELAITRALRYDASARDLIKRNRSLPSLPLSCTGFNFYWLDEVDRSIGVSTYVRQSTTNCQQSLHQFLQQNYVMRSNKISQKLVKFNFNFCDWLYVICKVIFYNKPHWNWSVGSKYTVEGLQKL